jgi:hypothetical protein
VKFPFIKGASKQNSGLPEWLVRIQIQPLDQPHHFFLPRVELTVLHTLGQLIPSILSTEKINKNGFAIS